MLKILKGWKLTSPPQVKYDEDFKSIFSPEYAKSQQCYESLNIFKCASKWQVKNLHVEFFFGF